MYPVPTSDLKSLSQQDIIIFVVGDQNTLQKTKWDIQVNTFIQMLATLYFYTGDKKTLEQLVMLMMTIVCK